MKLSIRSRAPSASSPVVRKRMQATPTENSGPEKELGQALYAAGMRFRKGIRLVPELKCRADIVFPRQRVCVFVDGCFWHGCPIHFDCPKTNTEWWKEKIMDVRARDERQTKQLAQLGWKVLRYWEHQLSDNLPAVVQEIRSYVEG